MDLLEPMRRAAEFGCEDFLIGGEGDVLFVWDDDYKDANCMLPYRGLPFRPKRTTRINRYAANRCECWWRKYRDEEMKRLKEIYKVTRSIEVAREHTSIELYCNRMIDFCRAFANEHGV